MNDLISAYRNLRFTIKSNFDERVWFMTDACLSVIASLTLNDLANPIGLNLVDGPSTEKTTVLSFFYELKDLVYRTDEFTPASFVSQAANIKKKDLANVDLLPRIQHKCLIIPELAPIMGIEKSELVRAFSILTRVFDGEGLLRDGGVHGQRGYEGDYSFVWLGATTPLRKEVWNVMGSLGSRFLFLTLESQVSTDDTVQDLIDGALSPASYQERVLICKHAVATYFEELTSSLNSKTFHRSIEWPRTGENRSIVRKIASLARFTASIRSNVVVWQSYENGVNTIDLTNPVIEGPQRLMSVLYGLARGHAVLAGRRQLSKDDLPLMVEVSLSSMPDDRRRVVKLLIEPHHPDKATNRGIITSTEIQVILGYSKPTALKVLRTMEVLGLGSTTGGESGPKPLKFNLKEEFSWLLTDEFLQYYSTWNKTQEGPSDVPF